MMMNLNSRIVSYYDTTNDAVMNEFSTDRRLGLGLGCARPVFSAAHSGILVTREEWTVTDSNGASIYKL